MNIKGLPQDILNEIASYFAPIDLINYFLGTHYISKVAFDSIIKGIVKEYKQWDGSATYMNTKDNSIIMNKHVIFYAKTEISRYLGTNMVYSKLYIMRGT